MRRRSGRVASYQKLPREFYLRPTVRVAKELLGKYLVRKQGTRILSGRIVEVEAYLGARDPASHAYKGKTRRNEVMFRAGGHLYVYFTYGMHFCSNVVTQAEGIGHAVLLRALEPVDGMALMRRNRSSHRAPAGTVSSAASLTVRELCSGPAKLCQAFHIGRRENGTDLCGGRIWIASNPCDREIVQVGASTRVGVSAGKEHRLRFCLKGSLFLSRRTPDGPSGKIRVLRSRSPATRFEQTLP